MGSDANDISLIDLFEPMPKTEIRKAPRGKKCNPLDNDPNEHSSVFRIAHLQWSLPRSSESWKASRRTTRTGYQQWYQRQCSSGGLVDRSSRYFCSGLQPEWLMWLRSEPGSWRPLNSRYRLDATKLLLFSKKLWRKIDPDLLAN